MAARSVRSGEFDLIARYFAPLATDWSGAFGLTDDAALFSISDGADRIVTTDALVEGTHFRPDDPPDRVAQKALRVNLSDLAAMGATPEVYTLALRVPLKRGDDWVAALAQGLAADQARYGVTLIGGDTVSGAGPAMLAVTAIGRLAEGPALRRGGAAASDEHLGFRDDRRRRPRPAGLPRRGSTARRYAAQVCHRPLPASRTPGRTRPGAGWHRDRMR